jgi:predicted MFS family arabinose efflux permease
MGAALLLLVPFVILLPWKKFAAGTSTTAESRQKALQGFTLSAALRSRVFWGLVQVFGCTAAAMFSIVVQLVAFFVDCGFSPLTAATAFGLIGLLSAASVMGSGVAADRFGYRQTISASFAGTATGMALLLCLTIDPSAALLVLFVPVFGLCMGVRGPIVSSVAARYFAGPRVATIYGLIYASNAVGAAVGAFAGGLLHDLTGGYRASIAMALALIATAALPFWTVPALRNFR